MRPKVIDYNEKIVKADEKFLTEQLDQLAGGTNIFLKENNTNPDKLKNELELLDGKHRRKLFASMPVAEGGNINRINAIGRLSEYLGQSEVAPYYDDMPASEIGMRNIWIALEKMDRDNVDQAIDNLKKSLLALGIIAGISPKDIADNILNDLKFNNLYVGQEIAGYTSKPAYTFTGGGEGFPRDRWQIDRNGVHHPPLPPEQVPNYRAKYKKVLTEESINMADEKTKGLPEGILKKVISLINEKNPELAEILWSKNKSGKS